MRSKKVSLFLVVVMIATAFVVGVSVSVSAEEPLPPDDPELPPIPEEPEIPEPMNDPWVVEGTGTYFEITDENYPNVALTSSVTVFVHLESLISAMSYHIEAEGPETSTEITLSGLKADWTYYLYQDSYLQGEITTDASGTYSYTQDIPNHHLIIIREEKSTIVINEWGDIYPSTAPITKVDDTYTLTGDINEPIIIRKGGIIFDGAGFTVDTPIPSYNGIFVQSVSGVTIQNFIVNNYDYCIYLYYSDNCIIKSNTVLSTARDVNIYYSDNAIVQYNTLIGDGNGIIGYGHCLNTIITGNTLSGINNAIGISVADGSIIEDNDISGYWNGIHFHSSSNVQIKDNTISVINDGIREHYSDKITISGNIITTDNWGIVIDSSYMEYDNIVSNNQISTIHSVGIYARRSQGILIDSNIVSQAGIGPASPYKSISLWYCDQAIITGNTVSGGGFMGISYVYSINGNIFSNTVTNAGNGIHLAGSNNVNIYWNTLSGNNVGILIGGDANYNDIYDNEILDNIGNGISIDNNCEGNLIHDNTISQSGYYGIFLRFGQYNEIYDNIVNNNGGGIYVLVGNNNIITGNTLSGNSVGLRTHYEGSNTFNDNYVTGSTTYGFYTSSATNNLIFHNNFVDNAVNAYDMHPADNNWHHPDLLEGNYWDDYFGWDDGSGTGKHAIAGDRIGDTEIPHPATNYDFYPFTLLNGWLNEPPVIDSITGPSDPIPVNTFFTVSGDFTDPNEDDEHTATWTWEEGETSSGDVDQVEDTVLGTYTYDTPGVYTISLEVVDSYGESDSMTWTQYVVVYDPFGAFVTGGGMIDSPPGAFPADPLLTGKAGFGFVSKYQKGQMTPGGNTQFRFHAADLIFQSSSYDWMIVAGPKAMFKGTGTVNGDGNYGFLISATDGDMPGGGGVDMFRIKIWDKDNNDEIVYDNGLGDADDADPATPLTHGSIKIHNG